MQHHTHTKGDIAVTATIHDLTKRGWVPFRPVSAEFLPFDLIAVREVDGDRKIRTFQVKHSRTAEHRKYCSTSFDYFALYLCSVEKVVYIPLSMLKNKNSVMFIATRLPNAKNKFWWYKDFLKVSKARRCKRTIDEFGKSMTRPLSKARLAAIAKIRKLQISDKLLSKLVWEKTLTEIAIMMQVSITAIRKQIKKSKIKYPPQGYWLRKERML